MEHSYNNSIIRVFGQLLMDAVGTKFSDTSNEDVYIEAGHILADTP